MVPRCLALQRPSIRYCDPPCRMLFEVDGGDPQWLVPLSGSLSNLLERELVVCRAVAWSEACSVSALVGVQRGLWPFEEELAEVYVLDGDRKNGSVVRW